MWVNDGDTQESSCVAQAGQRGTSSLSKGRHRSAQWPKQSGQWRDPRRRDRAIAPWRRPRTAANSSSGERVISGDSAVRPSSVPAPATTPAIHVVTRNYQCRYSSLEACSGCKIQAQAMSLPSLAARCLMCGACLNVSWLATCRLA